MMNAMNGSGVVMWNQKKVGSNQKKKKEKKRRWAQVKNWPLNKLITRPVCLFKI
jgi:hypothetical protein